MRWRVEQEEEEQEEVEEVDVRAVWMVERMLLNGEEDGEEDVTVGAEGRGM